MLVPATRRTSFSAAEISEVHALKSCGEAIAVACSLLNASSCGLGGAGAGAAATKGNSTRQTSSTGSDQGSDS
eukprot:350856-Chlamydomonas_euryale.AAC.4